VISNWDLSFFPNGFRDTRGFSHEEEGRKLNEEETREFVGERKIEKKKTE